MLTKGIPYVIAAPSGGGKTSLVNALVHAMPNILASVSFTTRPIRPGEQEGVNYHFISVEEFETLREQQTFLECANVFGHYYGTSKRWLEEKLTAGFDVILEIDWQGCRQIKQQFQECVSMFILPPSRATLLERLQRRAQDNPEVIAKRMIEAKSELSHYAEFDYLVVNDEFNQALADLQAIVCSHRLSQTRQSKQLAELLESLLA
ncbi:guanylate kinase [soil metagenome]